MNRTGISGDREVVAALNDLGLLSLLDVDKSALEAFQPMLEDVREHYQQLRRKVRKSMFPQDRIPVPAGKHLDQLMRVRKQKGTRTHRHYWLGAQGRGLRIAHLVEFGTAPHFQPNLKFDHPGARPRPGLAPAYEAHGDEVVERMATELWERIRDRALTFGRKAPRRR